MGAVSPIAQTGINLLAAEASQARAKKNTQQSLAQQISSVRAKADQERKKLSDRLSSELAKQRSRAGALGTNLTGGSIDALARNLAENIEEEKTSINETSERQVNLLRSRNQKPKRNLLDFTNTFLNSNPRYFR